MSYTITPNMNLIEPTVGAESGPTYAQDINNSLTLIDQHDHSTGKGVQIQPDGLNITSALTFQNNPLTNAQYLNMYLQTTAPTVGQSLYVKDGSESPALPDLFYYDGTNQIQITSGGQLAPVSASISGITYAGGTFSFEETQSGAPTTPANISSGSLIVRPNTAGTTSGVEINPASGISTQYSLFLPSIPSSTSFVTLDTSGNLSGSISTTGGITSTNIAANGVSRNNLVAVGQQISSSCGLFSSPSTSPAAVTNLTVTITTSGRPVMVFCQQDGSSAATAGFGTYLTSGGTSNQLFAFIQLVRGSTVVYESKFGSLIQAGTENAGFFITPSSLMMLDTPAAGTYTYQVNIISAGSAFQQVSAQYMVLVAYEL